MLRDPGSVFAAFLAAAATGGVIAGLAFGVASVVADMRFDGHWASLYLGLILIILAIAGAFIAYLAGLLLLGAPAWLLLRRFGRPGPRVAALTGAGLSILVAVLMRGSTGPRTLLAAVAVLAVAGAASGWVLHRMAHRPRS